MAGIEFRLLTSIEDATMPKCGAMLPNNMQCQRRATMLKTYRDSVGVASEVYLCEGHGQVLQQQLKTN
jgi:hypothetical protein